MIPSVVASERGKAQTGEYMWAATFVSPGLWGFFGGHCSGFGVMIDTSRTVLESRAKGSESLVGES